MTVTVEEFYGSPVGVRILDLCMTDEWYARKILLITERDDRVVQFGMVRIQLRFLKPPVRAAVLSGDTPLGRVLIQHDVLRRVEPSGFLRVSPCDATRAWFGPAGDTTTFGRTGTIFCDGQPAIDVVEVLAPVGG
jgi:chorismate-pyruvate lyase